MNKNTDDGKGIFRWNRSHCKITADVKIPSTTINGHKLNPTPCQFILTENTRNSL